MNPLFLAAGVGMGGGVYVAGIQYNNASVFQQAACVTTVVPDDDRDLPVSPCNRLYVGVTGNVAVLDYMRNPFVYQGVTAGTWIPTRIRRVLKTGTTAGGLGAEY